MQAKYWTHKPRHTSTPRAAFVPHPTPHPHSPAASVQRPLAALPATGRAPRPRRAHPPWRAASVRLPPARPPWRAAWPPAPRARLTVHAASAQFPPAAPAHTNIVSGGEERGGGNAAELEQGDGACPQLPCHSPLLRLLTRTDRQGGRNNTGRVRERESGAPDDMLIVYQKERLHA
eukprot:174844-Chlamydomonas_euryale.AAC.4